MEFKFRALAWGCLAAGMSLSAQAAQVVVDFDVLGLQAGSEGTALANQYQAKGLSFTGDAWLFHNGTDDGNLDRVPCVPSPTNCQPNGFVSNKGSGLTITVTEGHSFTGLLLDYAVGPLSFSFTVFSRADSSGNVKSLVRDIVGNSNGWVWTPGVDALSNTNAPTGKGVASLTGTSFGEIDKIVFNANPAFFAIDNLVFTDSSGGTGNPVPEPASFGLVALALGASGLVARRRRQR